MDDEQEELKLKTLCEFLISKRYNEVADFPRFEKCLKNLFIKENNSLQNVFDFIVGVFKGTTRKRKYITYTRLLEAYSNYKKEKNNNSISNDISNFFNKLLNSLFKLVDSGNNCLGQIEERNFSSSKFSNGKIFFLSRLVVLCNEEKKILGIKLEYNDNKERVKMSMEEDLYKALDIQLESEQKNNYIMKNKLRDSITHIYGTFNQTNHSISSIGFKCTSGKTVYFGKPEGEPFLFGSYGKKLQCLDLKIDENGINGLKVYFVENPLKNKNIELKENDKDKIFFDEELLLKENNINNYENIRRNQIIDMDIGDEEEDIDRFADEDVFIKPIFTFILENKTSMNKGLKINNKRNRYKRS